MPQTLRCLRPAVVAVAILLPCLSACGEQRKPHVFLVIWDTTRPDHLTPYGYHRDTTPNLAAIAGDATVFEEALASAPWTIPSVAGLFSGLYGHNHGVSYDPARPASDLSDDVHTLAQAMRDAGYATALITAQMNFCEKRGFRRGFDAHAHLPDRDLVAATLQFLDQTKNRPVFVVTYWLNPHAPWQPAPEDDLWSPRFAPPVNIYGGDESEPPDGYVIAEEVNEGKITLEQAQYDQLRALYDAELHGNDRALGELWAALQERGLVDRSVFVFLSDHGEGFGEHPRQRVWHDLPYETILRVPLIVRWPERFPATRVTTAVRTIDLYPTLLEIAGGAPEHAVNGESLFDVLEGDAGDRSLAGATQYGRGAVFYRAHGLKFFYSRTGEPEAEIYDLTTDPHERHNLAGSVGVLHAVEAEFAAFLDSTRIEGLFAETPASEEELERLRALGYTH